MGCFATEENTEDDNPPIGINYSRRRFKMKSVTRYFRNAVAASMQGTVNYKKERFFVVTEGELLSGKLSEENNFNIWKKEYDAESDNDEEKLKIKNVIIALKTLATEFRDGGKMEDNIEEMTSFFFLPLCVTRTGKLCMPVEGKIPWIPREYLRPMEDPLLAVGDGEKYDEFLEHTTNERYQLDSWQDYLAYAIKLYEFVAEIPFKSNYIRNGNELFKADGRYYLFQDSTVNASFYILQLYNALIKGTVNSLYDKITNGKIEPSKPLIKNTDISKMKAHVGQMGGAYPLSPSQREAMNHFGEIKEGNLLAVSGPPGTGKTTLAKVIANTTQADFKQINATVAGKKDMEEVVTEAKNNMGMYGRRTILFVDEIHRFNKGQQDYLLPFVEDGTLTLIGATTENPYFEVNGALLSRSRIFELKPLEKDDIKQLIYRAVTDSERGMGTYRVKIEEDAADFLADTANGDARAALNAVELGVLTTERSEDGLIHIDLAAAQECIQKRAVRYDKDGDNHYDTISAFIKSMRGSDPDAAVYYLARMLYAGEDIKFIARRIMICASEDVGNADPQALNVAVSAALAAERIGLPEAQIILSQAASYVACAPKSNAAYVAIQNAMENVKTTRTMPVPVHLQDRHYKGAAKLGHGEGYKYAHDYPKHYVKQQYLPDGMEGTVFYEPSDNGYEKQIKAHMKWLKD